MRSKMEAEVIRKTTQELPPNATQWSVRTMAKAVGISKATVQRIWRDKIYGDGLNVRDWLFVEDHCSAIETVLKDGVVGESYNIGGNNERTNLDIVRTICRTIDRLRPGLPHGSSESLISFVTDRPGHDRRYAIDATKIKEKLGWVPQKDFESGIELTVQWYLDNPEWVERVLSGDYRLERVGLNG